MTTGNHHAGRPAWQASATPHPSWVARVRRQLRVVFGHADEEVTAEHLQAEWDRGFSDTEASGAIHCKLTPLPPRRA